MKRTQRMKITALLLTLVLLLCNFPIPIFSVESGAQGAKDSTIPAQTVADSVMENPDAEQDTEGEIFEIVSRREKNVKHFRMPDGTVQAVVYGTAVHRKDTDGVWQDINNNLSANVSKVKNAYATDDLRLIFAKQYLPNEQLFVLNEDGYSVAMKLMGAPLSTGTGLELQGAASVTTVTNAPTREANATYRTIEEAQTVRNASSITYTNVRANTDLEYVLTGDSVKENIVVKQAGGSYTYDFALTLSGLTATLRADGSVQLSDAETETEQYVIPAPYMYDANGNYSWDVSYTLTQTGEGAYRMTVIADPDWINAEGRAFPVTVDPTIKREVLYDTYVDFYHPDTNYGGVENIILGEHTVVYIRAVMPSLPENATFSWAKLFLYYHYYDYVTSGSLTAGIYRAVNSWQEYSLTWNTANQNANMGLDTICLSTADFTPHSNPNLAAAFDVTEIVGDWLAGETNYGLGVKYLSGTNGSVFLNSYESSTNNCPFFQISYSEPAIAGGVYKIKSNYNGLYLDVANGGITPGTAVVQWPGTDTDNKRNQLFKIAHVGTDSTSTQQNYYSIRSMMNSATGLDICPEDTQYPVPTNQRIIVNSVPTSDQMHQYSSTNKWYLIYDKDRNAYTICNGPQAQTRYLSVLGSSTHGAQISTTNTLDASCYWTLIPYTGAEINDVVIDAFPRRMVESQSFDFNAYMYSSVVGRNGPVIYGVANEDYSDSNKATIDASTGVVTMHSAGLVRISVTFDGAPYIWYYNITVEPLLNGTYFFKNDEYGKYMQINNNANVSDVGAFFELWDIDGDDDQRWTVTHIGDGYYKIISVASGLAVTAPAEEDHNFTQTAYVGAMTQQFQITETGSGTYNIIPRSSSYYLSVGDGIFTSNGRNVELRRSQGGVENEWWLSMLPVSGYEIDYSPSIWNYSPVVSGTNCYAYSLNNQVFPGTNILWYMQPGEVSGYTLSSNSLTAANIINYVEADSNILGFSFEPIGKYDICSNGSYKVALVIAPGVDYHWYRQNPEGTWSHKPGGTNIVNTDASGHIIYDPETANRNYSYANYSIFVGYYEVTPLNNFYVNAATSTFNIPTSTMIELLPNKTIRPSYSSAVGIEKGMLYSEVTDLIGLPQHIRTFGLIVVEYELSNDNLLVVEYVVNAEGDLVVEKACLEYADTVME